MPAAARPAARPAPDHPPETVQQALREARISGKTAMIWHLLVDAGSQGVTSDEMAEALYPAGDMPPSWAVLRARHLSALRVYAEGQLAILDKDERAVPPRWRLSLNAPPTPAPPPPVPSQERRSPIGPAMTLVPIAFTNTAAEVDRLASRCCRWPIGDPGAPGFRFCDAARDEGKSYCPEHLRTAAAVSSTLPRSA